MIRWLTGRFLRAARQAKADGLTEDAQQSYLPKVEINFIPVSMGAKKRWR